MRSIIQLSAACLIAGSIVACGDRATVTETGIAPTAGVRFINAVPDTAGANGLDFRFVDIVENNAQYAIPFRNNIVTTGGIPAPTLVEYKATAAGQRHFRIFLDDPSPAVAQTVLKDSTITVEANHRYTVLLWGNARGGANRMKVTVIDETYDPGQRIGLRVINATSDAVDVRTYLATALNAGTVPTTATWAGLAGMSISQYVAVDTGQFYKFNVQPAGGGNPIGRVSVTVSGANVTIDPVALVGVANGTLKSTPVNGCYVGVDCDATPGTLARGTALTAIIFPASVAGSKAAQFSTPAIGYVWDKRPVRNPGT
jgi:hypothetical protein